MDAFAVAMCKGMQMQKFSIHNSLIISIFFGFFQGLMPMIGWMLGTEMDRFIKEIDHWIAFIMLTAIGVKMIYDAKHNDEMISLSGYKLKIRELLVLSIATSIDAMIVGIMFALLNTDIIKSASLISAITFVMSFIGVMIGCKFGEKFHKKAEILGGIILVLLGTKILLEHLKLIGG